MHFPLARIATLATAVTLLFGAPALAISNGVPDGDDHPNVGMLALVEEGVPIGWCSGFYAGNDVFVTAGHCLADMPEDSQWAVTFETEFVMDEGTFAVTAASWYDGTGFAIADDADMGVVTLATTPDVDPVDLPAGGYLDGLEARGGLRPGATFDNVGYGLIPSFGQAPPSYALPSARMRSTSRFMTLLPERLRLFTNQAAGFGGNCFGDSGGPQLVHGTNLAVSLSAGGDQICRTRSSNQRLDVPGARAFLDTYLDLPTESGSR